MALVGIAQEKASVWRSWKARRQEQGAHPHMEWGRQMAFVNHSYFYRTSGTCSESGSLGDLRGAFLDLSDGSS